MRTTRKAVAFLYKTPKRSLGTGESAHRVTYRYVMEAAQSQVGTQNREVAKGKRANKNKQGEQQNGTF